MITHKEMRTNLKEINKIRFNDFSEYDSDRCNTGGCYGFWTDYNRLENGLFEVSYGTTAEFNWCPVCGDFVNDPDHDCGNFETITEEELLNIINNFKETEGNYIEYK